jgi:hypothetical protein
LCDGCFQDSISQTISLGWLQTVIFLISASWVARITGISHQYPVCLSYSSQTIWLQRVWSNLYENKEHFFHPILTKFFLWRPEREVLRTAALRVHSMTVQKSLNGYLRQCLAIHVLDQISSKLKVCYPFLVCSILCTLECACVCVCTCRKLIVNNLIKINHTANNWLQLDWNCWPLNQYFSLCFSTSSLYLI